MSRMLLSLFMLFAVSVGHSQAVKRHPRVVEIERMLQNDVQTSLRDVLPGQSFHVSVRIEPLHRESVAQNGKESLPYFESTEEIRDEWDNPNKTDYELLTRVMRISVKATVPDTIPEEQVAEVKSAIVNRIPYTEGRDLIEVVSKKWPQPTPDPSRNTPWILGIGFSLMFFLGVVYFFVSFFATGRLSNAIKNIRITNSESAGGGGLPMASLSGSSQAQNNSNSAGFGSGRVQLNDTIRMTEVIMGLIRNVESSGRFPILQDMALFEQYIQSHPRSVGGLLAEFPSQLRSKLFSYSYSPNWLNGLTDAGEIDQVAFELMNKLVRIERSAGSGKWDQLLILCWRLDSQLPQFLKNLDSQDSFLILKSLPQSIALQTARTLMPGEWAVVLKKGGPQRTLSEEKIEKYSALALEILPLRSAVVLEQYQQDTDLIKYLKITDPSFEKEVYGAAPAESELAKLRPPFYPVLDASPEVLKEFTSLVPMEDWALSFINLQRKVRASVDSQFSDKQKFRLAELLRRYDKAAVNIEVVGDARERIAKHFQDFCRNKEMMAAQSTQIPAEESAKEAA